MAPVAKCGHTNIAAADWPRLVDFHTNVFGCVPVPPERNLRGEALEQGAGIAGAELAGIHLRLPGHGAEGPTLEIFTYGLNDTLGPGLPNRTGFGHIAFIVPDVLEAEYRSANHEGTRMNTNDLNHRGTEA